MEIEIELELRATNEEIRELGLQRDNVGHAPDRVWIATVEQGRHVPGVATKRANEIGTSLTARFIVAMTVADEAEARRGALIERSMTREIGAGGRGTIELNKRNVILGTVLGDLGRVVLGMIVDPEHEPLIGDIVAEQIGIVRGRRTGRVNQTQQLHNKQHFVQLSDGGVRFARLAALARARQAIHPRTASSRCQQRAIGQYGGFDVSRALQCGRGAAQVVTQAGAQCAC